jgi:hypothetical protein
MVVCRWIPEQGGLDIGMFGRPPVHFGGEPVLGSAILEEPLV